MITSIQKFRISLNEAVDLRCPNCQDNLGKDVENPKLAYCGNCGEDNIKNPRGYVDESFQPNNQVSENSGKNVQFMKDFMGVKIWSSDKETLKTITRLAKEHKIFLLASQSGVKYYITESELDLNAFKTAVSLLDNLVSESADDRYSNIKKNLITLIGQAFDEEVHASVGDHFGSPSAHLEGKEAFMERIKSMIDIG